MVALLGDDLRFEEEPVVIIALVCYCCILGIMCIGHRCTDLDPVTSLWSKREDQ